MKTLSLLCHATCGSLFLLSSYKTAAAAEQLLLWNKLGSAAEVQHSEVGLNGTIVGNVLFEQNKHGNGFRSAQRTGDKNTPTNYVRFYVPQGGTLSAQGSIEFWYHPDWEDSSVGHVVDLLNFGDPEVTGQGPNSANIVFTSEYNDWTNTINTCIANRAEGAGYQICDYVYLEGNTQWSTTRPVHIAYSWDSTAEKKLTIYLNGQSAGTDYRETGTPEEFTWIFEGVPVLSVGSRMYSGDWERHNWEPSVDGVIDNIKVWNYAKTDFSDRFDEDAGAMILWNKLGSANEVRNSEIGPDGEIVGSVLFEKGKHGNGFRSAQRIGDKNIPSNFIRFPLIGLSPYGKGCIEFWYHPDWKDGDIGHVIDLLSYGIPDVSPANYVISIHYNDWQGRIQGWVKDNAPVDAAAISYIYPSVNSYWSTSHPIHFAFTWDAAADKKVSFYIDGKPADSGYEHLYGTPDTFAWYFDQMPYLYLGSRMYSGDWDRHNWEPNVDGVIDNIKVWNYAKTDFSDRFTEVPFAADRANLQMIYQLLLKKR